MVRPAIAFAIIGVLAGPQTVTWHSEVARWHHGADAQPWERLLQLPRGGSKPYRVALQPLWALEGGIVAIEITVALPSEPFENLLGERENNVSAPFVLTVEDLADGIERSAFGSTRVLPLPEPARGVLRVVVLGSELGHGVGVCDDCRNIQALTARVDIEGSPK